MAAIVGGQSIDTTMGFTPTSGLVMGTRCGDIDPGVLIYLLEQRKDAASVGTPAGRTPRIELGISGTRSDKRALGLPSRAPTARAAGDRAFLPSREKTTWAPLPRRWAGLEAWYSPSGWRKGRGGIRERICAGFEFLGIELDPGSKSRFTRR